MIEFDHIAIAGETLAAAQSHVEEALGVKLQPGGEHEVFHTHNALLGLDEGLYLEAIAINPDAPEPNRPRWFDLDRFSGVPRLTNWICRTENMETALAALPAGLGAPVQLQRGELRWRMAVPEDGVLPFDNCAPAVIQWQTDTHPVTLLAASGVRLKRLTITHPKADALVRGVQGLLNDDRVGYETGPVGLHAAFQTPHGPRALSS